LALSFKDLFWTTEQQTTTVLSLPFTVNALVELFTIFYLPC